MVVLTRNFILQKSRADSLVGVRNLNLWGNELTDVSILSELVNVEVLSLSVNQITSLRSFSTCKKLTELYLRKNKIADLSELHWMKDLPLQVLWLNDNPCCANKDYRLIVARMLPRLSKLDNREITPQERKAAANMDVASMLQSKSSRPESSSPKSRRAQAIPQPENPPRKSRIPKKSERASQPAGGRGGWNQRSNYQEEIRSNIRAAVMTPPVDASEISLGNPDHSLSLSFSSGGDFPVHHKQPQEYNVQPVSHERRRQQEHLEPKIDQSPAAKRAHPQRTQPQRPLTPQRSGIVSAILILLNELDGPSLHQVKAQADSLLRKL